MAVASPGTLYARPGWPSSHSLTPQPLLEVGLFSHSTDEDTEAQRTVTTFPEPESGC